MTRTLLLAAVLISCCCGPVLAVDYVCLDPLVEIRGIWIDAGAMGKTEPAIREQVRGYAQAGFNVLFPETVSRGYAVYPSKLLARDPRFADAPDTLAIMIQEAHRLGLEVHPWVWVFRAGYTQDRGGILTAHPDWAERDARGQELSANGGYWLSPANPEVQNFLADLFRELLTRYDVDGLHLDYIRYETQESGDYGYSDYSIRRFVSQHGYSPDPEAAAAAGTADVLGGPVMIAVPEWLQKWNLFREQQVSGFVERIAGVVRGIGPTATGGFRPSLALSVAVGETPRDARIKLMQNWQHWVDNRWLDFVVPMSYEPDNARFSRLVKLQRYLTSRRSLLAPGLGLHRYGDPGQTVTQIALAREGLADGQVLFSASYLRLPYANPTLLPAGPYAKPASLPFRSPLDRSQELCDRAGELCSTGQYDEATYFAARATALAAYAAYREAALPYLPPAPWAGWP